MPIEVKVHGFEQGGTIPKEFSCEGSDDSPEITLGGVPDGAKSLALIVDDPDAPSGTFNHWLLYNIEPKTTVIRRNAGKEKDLTHGKNDFGRSGYGGPCPPKGHGPHRYYFTIYALDVFPSLNEGLDRKGLDREISGHVLDKGQYMGKYERK